MSVHPKRIPTSISLNPIIRRYIAITTLKNPYANVRKILAVNSSFPSLESQWRERFTNSYLIHLNRKLAVLFFLPLQFASLIDWVILMDLPARIDTDTHRIIFAFPLLATKNLKIIPSLKNELLFSSSSYFLFVTLIERK